MQCPKKYRVEPTNSNLQKKEQTEELRFQEYKEQ